MSGTIRGMRAVGVDGPSNGGDRDLRLVLERDGETIEVAEIFNGTSQVFDPTEAVEYTTVDDPSDMRPLQVGDRLTVTVEINA